MAIRSPAQRRAVMAKLRKGKPWPYAVVSKRTGKAVAIYNSREEALRYHPELDWMQSDPTTETRPTGVYLRPATKSEAEEPARLEMRTRETLDTRLGIRSRFNPPKADFPEFLNIVREAQRDAQSDLEELAERGR